MKQDKIYDIFDLNTMLTELTSNMDEYTQFQFSVLCRSNFINKNIKLSQYNQFINVLQLFLTFILFYTDTYRQDQNKSIYISETYAPLFTSNATDKKYNKIPRYLHGVIDPRTNKFRHPNTSEYLIKPARNKSKQFITQIEITKQSIQTVQQNEMLLNSKNISSQRRIIALQNIYKELLKLVSMCNICRAPQKDITKHTPGSLDILCEYKVATNFELILSAVNKREHIATNTHILLQQYEDKLHDLEQQYNTQYEQLTNKQNQELSHTKSFQEFQQLNQLHYIQRANLSIKYIDSKKEITTQQKQLQKNKKTQQNFERIQAQMQIAAITRMR